MESIQIKQTINSIKQHYILFLTSIIGDISFFYTLTRLHIEIFKAAAGHIKELQKIIQAQMDKLVQTEYAQMDRILMGNTEFALQYHQIIKYLLIFATGTTIIWFALRGANWLIAHKIANNKITTKEFTKRFTFFSTIGLISLLAMLVLYGGMLNYTTFNPLPIINAKMTNVFFGIMLVALYYFLSIAFALPHKTKFRDVLRFVKNTKIIFSFLVIESILAILIILPAFFIRTNYWTALLLTLILTVPFMTLARIYLIKILSVKKLPIKVGGV